jgi:hypothetical protein
VGGRVHDSERGVQPAQRSMAAQWMLDAAAVIGGCYARHGADMCLVIGYSKTHHRISPEFEYVFTNVHITLKFLSCERRPSHAQERTRLNGYVYSSINNYMRLAHAFLRCNRNEKSQSSRQVITLTPSGDRGDWVRESVRSEAFIIPDGKEKGWWGISR